MNYHREAERLRIVLDVFAHAHPAMTLDEALPLILAAEKRTAELEGPAVSGVTGPHIALPDSEPATLSAFISLQPDIQDFIKCSKKIDAIKAVRARTGVGLKEAKEGVEYWATHMTSAAPATPPSYATDPVSLADWIDGEAAVKTHLRAYIDAEKEGTGRIRGTRELRARYPITLLLKEAVDGVDEWIARNE